MAPEPRTLQDAVKYFADPTNCRNYVAVRRWSDGVECPRCGSKKVVFLEKYNRWQCSTKHDRRQFTVKTSTIFEDSPLGLDKWLMAMWLATNCKNGVSSWEIHRAMKVTQKTAWFMLHRIRYAMQDEGHGGKIGGEVEVDETYIGGKARGTVGHEHEGSSPRVLLLRRIIALRDSIEAESGMLSESYPLIREAREK
jgi:transposase-like protein